MGEQTPEPITQYEAMFTARTGLTILLPKQAAFDGGEKTPVSFRVSPESPRDVLVTAERKSIVLKNLKKDFLDEAVERGFIMFYEMKDDEVVRCTPCSYAKK
jgi:hypothetical protein